MLSNIMAEMGTIPQGFNLPNFLADLEIRYIEFALAESSGCKAEAARKLGLNRTTLVEKMRKYGFTLNKKRAH